MQDFKKYLLPVLKQIDSIVDTTNIKPENELEKVEYQGLIKTVLQVKHDIDVGLASMERLEEQIEHFIWVIDNETGDDKSEAIGQYNKLLREMEGLVERINRSLSIIDSPYFGKIIFNRTSSGVFTAKEITVYIGKFGYMDAETGVVLVSDWRAPIANLYYNYAGPIENVSFESPAGEQFGDVTQKRQINISSGRITELYDVKTGNSTADEFLLSQLNQRIGKKLQEIVSTIQRQQNEIIRDDIDKPIFIQGVAGSGKTTIILHRLAYLFYTYKDKVRTENSMIIAPNKMFLDYISDVLPSLGVKGLYQNTFLFWARDVLGLKDKFVLDTRESFETSLFKGSVEFKQLLERYLEYFEEKFLEELPTTVSVEVENMYYEMKEKNTKLSIKELMDLATESVFARRRFAEGQLGGLPSRNDTETARIKTIKEYSRKNLDTYKMYTSLFKSRDFDVSDIIEPVKWKKIVLESISAFKKQPKFQGYAIDDLAPMLFIESMINGTENMMKDYIVVDEAQDLSPMQLMAITIYAKNGNITFAGDTAQAIVPPYHITVWTPVQEAIGSQTAQEPTYHVLNKSYRSTHEIISFANEILERHFPDSYMLPEAVLRHGKEVEVVHTEDESTLDEDAFRVLRNLIHQEIKADSASVAVLTRTEADADILHTKFLTENFDAQLFSYKDEDYHAGIQVLPIKYAKGLEFDSVIVCDVTNSRYSNKDESRLLYVAMTRALHRLTMIVPKGNPSKLLPEKLRS